MMMIATRQKQRRTVLIREPGCLTWWLAHDWDHLSRIPARIFFSTEKTGKRASVARTLLAKASGGLTKYTAPNSTRQCSRSSVTTVEDSCAVGPITWVKPSQIGIRHFWYTVFHSPEPTPSTTHHVKKGRTVRHWESPKALLQLTGL
jgi:hypothetical protein